MEGEGREGMDGKGRNLGRDGRGRKGWKEKEGMAGMEQWNGREGREGRKGRDGSWKVKVCLYFYFINLFLSLIISYNQT